MSHYIELLEVQGERRASYIENGREQVAWHRLGTRFDCPLTAAEAIEGCFANYTVSKQPLLAVSPQLMRAIEEDHLIAASELKSLLFEDKMATMRIDNLEPLGIVSKDYGVVQNQHAFDFVDLMTKGKRGSRTPVIECAGVLGRGERIFITAKFPEPIRINNSSNDVIDMYIVFTTTHDGTGAVTCMVTPVRVVCNNTLNIAFRNNRGKIMWRHTSNVLNRIDLTESENAKRAYQALNLYDVYCKEFKNSLSKLTKRKVTDNEIKRIVGNALLTREDFTAYEKSGYNFECLGIENAARNLLYNAMEAIYTGVGQQNLTSGTGLWLINGITTFFQNKWNFRSDESRMNSLFGGRAQRALQSSYLQLMAR